MKIDCISDLHGYFPELEGGDLLIVAGDLTARHTKNEFSKFEEWYQAQNYRKKVFIAGNHDNLIENGEYYFNHEWMGYLCDSGTEFEGLKIWGSPWTSRFPGMNFSCCAFTEACNASLKEYWDKIPDDVDILITHNPPYGILDRVSKDYGENISVGDKDLRQALEERICPKLHVYGHIHEHGGQTLILKRSDDKTDTICVNCSHVNERYKPVNKPVRIFL